MLSKVVTIYAQNPFDPLFCLHTFALCCSNLIAVDVTVEPTIWERNGKREIPSGLFGTHNVPLTDQRVAEWGIGSTRIITHNPQGHPRIARGITERVDKKGRTKRSGYPQGIEIVEAIYDRYQPALTVSNPWIGAKSSQKSHIAMPRSQGTKALFPY